MYPLYTYIDTWHYTTVGT